MTGGADAGDLVDRQPDIVTTGEHRLTAMDADADANRALGRPLVSGQGALCRGRRAERAGRRRKGAEEGVALGAEDPPAGGFDSPDDQRSMLLEQRRIIRAQPLKHACRPLDVGEQEGRRAADVGRVGAHRRPRR